MENKLQQLTKKLYDQGLAKGKQDAETMIAQAKQQAHKIVSDATGEARDAGIRAGTVIIEMNNQPVEDVAAFRRILKESAGKDKILVYLRYGEISRYMSLKLK